MMKKGLKRFKERLNEQMPGWGFLLILLGLIMILIWLYEMVDYVY
jgi:hypothetical protein